MEKVVGPPIPDRIASFYQTPRPHPWRPTLGYENVEVVPMYVLMSPHPTPSPHYRTHGGTNRFSPDSSKSKSVTESTEEHKNSTRPV